MEYLIRFTQWHETFRLAETQAIAYLLKIDLKILSYSDEVRKGRPPPPPNHCSVCISAELQEQ